MNLDELQKILRKCWSKETSGDPHGWTEKNPAWMQCAPTVLVVHDFFGGEIVEGEARVGQVHLVSPHYWNQLPAGQEIDFTKEQFSKNAVISKFGLIEIEKTTNVMRAGILKEIKRKYTLLRLAVENEIRPNALFSDEIYRLCFEAAQNSECQKMKFGCLVFDGEKLIAAAANKIIEPLRHLCEPECIRYKIASRTESMIGACGHAEEWALQDIFKQKINPELCSFYIAGFDAKTNNPWLKKEAADHSCLRCAAQMHMAGVGKIWVPFLDHWACLTTKEAVQRSAAYALKEKKI